MTLGQVGILFLQVSVIACVQLPVVKQNLTYTSGYAYKKNVIDENATLQLNFSFKSTDLGLDPTFEINSKLTKILSEASADIYYKKSSPQNNVVINLYIRNPTTNTPGVYEVRYGDEKLNMTITSPPLIAEFDKVKRNLETYELKMRCKLAGFPLPARVFWSQVQREKEFGSEMLVDLSQPYVLAGVTYETYAVPNDTLIIADLQRNHSGLWQCRAQNAHGEDTAVARVMVKDRLGALYPFLAIVLEVAVLVTVILLYERKRSRDRKTKAAAALQVTASAVLQQAQATESATQPQPASTPNSAAHRGEEEAGGETVPQEHMALMQNHNLSEEGEITHREPINV